MSQNKIIIIGQPEGIGTNALIGKSAMIGTSAMIGIREPINFSKPRTNPSIVRDVPIPTSDLIDQWALYLQDYVDFRIDQDTVRVAYWMDCAWLIGVRLDPLEQYGHYFTFQGFDTLRREALLSNCSMVKCGLRLPMDGDSQEFKDLHRERMKPYTLQSVENFGDQYTNGFHTMPVHIGTEIALISNLFCNRISQKYEFCIEFNGLWYAFDSRKLPNLINDHIVLPNQKLIERGILQLRAYFKFRGRAFESVENFVATYCD